jgi:hypothetical protein
MATRDGFGSCLKGTQAVPIDSMVRSVTTICQDIVAISGCGVANIQLESELQGIPEALVANPFIPSGQLKPES